MVEFCKSRSLLVYTDLEIVFAGKHVRNLEMHGRVGVISHVVLDKYYFDPSSDNHEHQVFE